METTSLVYVGIDISKETFDACLLPATGKALFRKFENQGKDFAKMVSWARFAAGDCDLRFCMEATGSYGVALTKHLQKLGLQVSVVNPSRIKSFGDSLGACNKTDKSASLVIAHYCRERSPKATAAPDPEVLALRQCLRRYDELKAMRTMETNRRQNPELSAFTSACLDRLIMHINCEIKLALDEVKRIIRNSPRLHRDEKLLRTIPAIGPIASASILAELPEVSGFPTAKSAAAFCGLNPKEHQSGTSVRKRPRMAKHGNAQLRTILFMCALKGKTGNPLVAPIYNRRLAAGRPKMVALGAAMRKLMMIAYGVLKNQTPFDPHHLGKGIALTPGAQP